MEEVRRDAAAKVRRSAQGATQQPRRDAVPYRQGLVKPPYGYVFHLPNRTIREVCPSLDTSPATFLAYVEWFSLLMAIPDPTHCLYRVSRLRKDGECWDSGGRASARETKQMRKRP